MAHVSPTGLKTSPRYPRALLATCPLPWADANRDEPPLAHRLFAADYADRRALEPLFRALHRVATSAVGQRAWMDGAYDKMYVKRHSPTFPLTLLPPHSGASDAQFAAFNHACDSVLSSFATVPAS
jgi:hypothetical protein